MVLKLLAPQLALTAGLVGALALGMRRTLPWLAVRWLGAGALLAAAGAAWLSSPAEALPLLRLDEPGRVLTILFCLTALPVALGPWRDEVPVALALGCVLGASLIASAGNLLMLFIGLELMSLPAYLLASRRQVEAGVKYFFAGSVAGSFFLLGVALHYAATGSLELRAAPLETALSQAGLMLMAAAALFKLGAVPLHFWLPDVYEASEPEVSAFFSTGVKAGAVLLLARVAELGRVPVLPWLGAVTAVYGAVMGLRQRSLQRLLAYSSIAHAGLLILGSGTAAEPRSLLVYLYAYFVMAAGSFLWVGASGCAERVDLKGYAKAHPASAAAFAVLLLSLAGIPPTGGFVAKLLILWDAVVAGAYGPALVAALASLAALGYYLGLIRDMYFEEPEGAPRRDAGLAPGVCAALSAVMGGVLWLWR